MPLSSSSSESLLVFSDVHLGSDIQDRAENPCRRSSAVDRDLVALLDYYRGQTPHGERWRIVIAGDFIDFIGISIGAGDASIATELTEEEQAHGLGSAVDHARLKLARVSVRHADVFRALARFIAAGHALSVVHGNHDIELHWDEVKADFRSLLSSHVEAWAREAFEARIEFHPWFFYRDGVAYIEHGHQYDPFCSTEHIMAPLSPLDPRRVARGFCDVLLRYVVRTTRGMKEHGHETVGVAHYVAFGVRLGLSGLLRLASNFALAVYEMFRLRRAHLSDAARALRTEHDARVAKLAVATRVGLERLRALLALQTPPITRTVHGILGSVLLDRIGVALVALVALAIVAGFGGLSTTAAYVAVPIAALWILLHVFLSRRRIVDPAEHMVDRAAHVARLFPAAFVVMGHTHIAAAVPAGDATYINVGSWAEEAEEIEGDAHAAAPPRATRTHLVIHVRDDQPEAHFRRWDEAGPPASILPPQGPTRTT